MTLDLLSAESPINCHDITYKCLLVERSMLLLMLDVGQPWLDTAGIPEDVLLVDRILVRL